MKKICTAGMLLLAISGGAVAQQVASGGTLVTVSATGEARAENNEARALFFIEEQDKDKAAAASRVNQKMKQGIDVLKKEDPQATLASRNYYTYPVYAEERPQAAGGSVRKRQLAGWRVGQYLDMKTENLQKLPVTVAAAQNILALNGVTFGLSDALSKRLDATRMTDAYQNLMARLQVIAKAMGHNAADAVIETIDFDGGDTPGRPYMAASAMEKTARMDSQVAEASFEPGESTLATRVVAHVRFK